MSVRAGTVYLVGAGPGDPGLMTVRGMDVLRRAGAVLHDRLIAPDLLGHAESASVVENVGKAPGRSGPSQQDINARLIELARAGHAVCRLKGGDPFVFGRGAEEARALATAGVPCEIVPGVSAATGVPAASGVPLTDRAVAPAVTIVTGHEDPSKTGPQVDWAALARAPGTIVIVMGMATLADRAARLLAGGRSPDEPVVVIQNGTLPDQRVVSANLATIATKVASAGLSSPAVVVIGPAAAASPRADA